MMNPYDGSILCFTEHNDDDFVNIQFTGYSNCQFNENN